MVSDGKLPYSASLEVKQLFLHPVNAIDCLRLMVVGVPEIDEVALAEPQGLGCACLLMRSVRSNPFVFADTINKSLINLG
jgi:hypothetical protein